MGTAMKVFIDGFEISKRLVGDSMLFNTSRRVSRLELYLWKSLTDAFNPNRDAHENIICNAHQPKANPHL